MIRDPKCDKSHFDKSIAFYIGDRDYYDEALKTQEKSQIFASYGTIYAIRLRLTICYYSAGFALKNVKDEFIGTLKYFDFFAEYISHTNDGKLSLDNYNLILWTVSLAILFECDEIQCRDTAKAVDKLNRPDRLVDLILKHKLKDRTLATDSFYADIPSDMADRYRPLFKIFSDSDNTAKTDTLKAYLKLWYKRQQLCSWYGNHKKVNYFGYWSFESAAIAKIFSLPEQILSKNKHFPKDLL